jgi:lipopolysaccharide biosynthesis glycosyltransferase
MKSGYYGSYVLLHHKASDQILQCSLAWYNPSISMEEIRNAAVVHFSSNMKPWLDISMNQFRHLWKKYVDYGDSFIRQCNFAPPYIVGSCCRLCTETEKVSEIRTRDHCSMNTCELAHHFCGNPRSLINRTGATTFFQGLYVIAILR